VDITNEENPLWTFSLDRYGRNGVPPLCLALQECLSLDVNILLFCIWQGDSGNAFKAQELHVATAAARHWHETTVLPLRAVRQILKSRRFGHDAETQEAFRTTIKKEELRAEQMEQDLLAAAAVPDQCEGAGTAEQNVRAYLEMMGVEPSPEDCANIAELVRLCCD